MKQRNSNGSKKRKNKQLRANKKDKENSSNSGENVIKKSGFKTAFFNLWNLLYKLIV